MRHAGVAPPDGLDMMDAAWAACTADNQLVIVVTLAGKNPDAPPQPFDTPAAVRAYVWRHPRAEIKFTPGAKHAKTTGYSNRRCASSRHWTHTLGEETLVDLRGASPKEHVNECWPDAFVQRVELRNEELHDPEDPTQFSVLVYDTYDD
jgi:hypothetical protein